MDHTLDKNTGAMVKSPESGDVTVMRRRMSLCMGGHTEAHRDKVSHL